MRKTKSDRSTVPVPVVEKTKVIKKKKVKGD